MVLAFVRLIFHYFFGLFAFMPPKMQTYTERTEGIYSITSGKRWIWFSHHIPANPRGKKLIIWFHGNAMDIGCLHEETRQWSNEFGCEILCMEYSGYGLMRNDRSDFDLINSDAEAVFKHAVHNLGYAPKEIVLLGHSLGTGIAVELARRVRAEENPRLVLISPYTSLIDVGRDVILGALDRGAGVVIHPRFFPIRVVVGFLKLFDPLPSEETAAKYPLEIQALHGAQDLLIPLQHMRLICEAGGPTHFEHREGHLIAGDHNDMLNSTGIAKLKEII